MSGCCDWSQTAWWFVPLTNLMQFKLVPEQIGKLLDVMDLWSLLKQSGLRMFTRQILRCRFPDIKCAQSWGEDTEFLPTFKSTQGLENGQASHILYGGESSLCFLYPTPVLHCPLGWRLWPPIRGEHSQWNSFWCQPRFPIHPRTLQYQVPPWEWGIGRNQSWTGVSISGVCLPPAACLSWVSDLWALSIFSLGSLIVQVCFRPKDGDNGCHWVLTIY